MKTQSGRCFSLSPWAIQTTVQESFPVCVQHPTFECQCLSLEITSRSCCLQISQVEKLGDWDLFEIQWCTDILLAAYTLWFPRPLLFLGSWSFSFTDKSFWLLSYMEQWKRLFATASLQFSGTSMYKKMGWASSLFLNLSLSKDSFKAIVWWGKWWNDIRS